ncbi:acyl-phosphate glycerol-3-phosphate acyltransferase [Cohaesibacter sp. ES.047]|uniref:glycerol-3-phosphate 1-O-acyltransferase PlsY n=1 Tax=Cohaesibacter sp. ES.047 TaxID=1798205 RepID=UPI000BB71DDF|nr:glycerol-3-phosphate 1-O-acyltransferase PlsY [Cohaesibacter sp. ES.047]SNY93904.1 acyl-phosphate glycerol-3-phosphate acyltransferase [Cohaesibacter sp. ES.047]
MPDPITWSHSLPYLITALIFGYVLGSTPFGLILTRFAGLGDVRSIGSGNIGATNVLRTGNKLVAALTLLGDLLKGTLAVLIANEWGGETAHVAGMGAFLGHLFPFWLGFKGGKGVATFLGVLLGLYWPGFLLFGFVWLATAYITRYSSLSALIASGLTPFAMIGFGEWQLAELFAVLAALLWLKHKSNINHLANGTESKIGQKQAPPDSETNEPMANEAQPPQKPL